MGAPQQMIMSHKSAAVTYATWNPSDKSANITLSSGNLIATATAVAWKSVRSTLGKSTGKWYRECVVSGPASWNAMVGVGSGSDTLSNFVGFNSTGNSYYSYISKSDGANRYNNNTNLTYGAAFTLGQTIGVALNMDAGEVTFYKNNVSQGIITGLSGTQYPMCSPNENTLACTANFGATTMTYTAPSGYNQGLYT